MTHLQAHHEAELLVAEAASRVCADDLMVLRACHPEFRQVILRHAGPDLRRFSRATAQALAGVLRGSDRRRRTSLVDALTQTVAFAFANHDGLTKEDCIALLDAHTAPVVLARAPHIAEALRACRTTPTSLIMLVLANVYRKDMPLAGLALALMAGTTGPMGTAVAPAWGHLRRTHPELPQMPLSIGELRDMQPLIPPAAGSEPEAVVPPRPPRAAPLRMELDTLQRTFQAAAEAADSARRALSGGRRPQVADLDLMRRCGDSFDLLREKVENEHDTALADDTLDALDQVITELEVSASRDAFQRALVSLQGPAPLEPVLREVREYAAADSPIIGVLAELIRLSADPSSGQGSGALIQRFCSEAPTSWLPLLPNLHYLRVPEALPASASDGSSADAVSGDDSGSDGYEPAPPDDPPTPPPGLEEIAAESDDGLGALDALITTSISAEQALPAKTLHPGPHGDTASESTSVPALEATPSPEPATAPDAPPGPAQAEEDIASHDPAPTAPPASSNLTPPATPEVSSSLAPASTADRSAEPGEAGSLEEDAVEAEAAALRAGRFGLAAWVRASTGRPQAEVDARRCAAIAGELARFSGGLSAAFAESASGLSMKALAHDPAGQLLAWAASLRSGLIHPTPEAAELLESLSPALSSSPGLLALRDGFLRVAQAGAYLTPGMSGWMSDASHAETRRQEASASAAKILEEGPTHKIKFALATDVWKFLLSSETSSLHRLLCIAAQDDAEQAKEATQSLARLRSGGGIARLVDETTGLRASSRYGSRINYGARTKLVDKIDKALGHVADWVTAISEVEAARTDDAGVAWVVRQLTELRETVSDNRDRALEELKALATTGDPVLAAAVQSAGKLVENALAMLDGRRPVRSEPAVMHLLNGDLLLAPAVLFRADSLEPASPPAPEAVLALCSPGNRDWRTAFEVRARRGDHEGTRVLLTVLAQEDSHLAAELQRRREILVEEARVLRSARVEGVRDRLAEWRRDGVIGEKEAARFSARLRGLNSDDRDDFGTVSAELDLVESQADEVRDREIAAELAALDRHSAGNADVANAAPRIRAMIESGDLTTAREFIAQARAGRSLPETTLVVDRLAQFFPAFPQVFDELSVRRGRHHDATEAREGIQRLRHALQSGGELSDLDLTAALTRTGLSLREVVGNRRGVAENGLRTWYALSQSPKGASNFTSAITAVLRMIGLEGEQIPQPPEQNRQWITLSPVKRIGDPLLPAFGSRMSTAGDRLRLLLVWKPSGPQQVTELLKDQPEDQTILVFYFGVLGVAERRELVALTRRRPTPAVAFLDHAAIAYLACLPHADWATTVSLLAPFTSSNPYAPTGEVPEEMFYGRQDQLREVTARTGSSFVFGGRQLGKSALLRKAERKLRETDANRRVISDIIQNIGRVAPVSAVWPMLAGKLADAEVLPRAASSLSEPKEICHRVREWIEQDPARQLLILLDEADEFLNKDARDASFANVIALRNLRAETDGRVKVVFAGLHQTARFESLPNQPLAHLGTPIAVGPLDPQDAYNLLVRPMTALGFRFPPRLAARVIAEANNAPALIQLFADALLTRLRRHSPPQALPYDITREDVDAVWRDQKLARGFRDRFEWTLNLDKRYKVIAYTVAFHTLSADTDVSLTAGELRSECQSWWPRGFGDATSDGFRGLLEECVNLGVLSAEGERYRLRTPHILTLLGGAEEVESVLLQAENFDLPDSFDAQSYRDAYRTNGDRSPLTSGQVNRLLSPQNVLHLIAGSPALQIDRVEAALEEASTRHRQARTLRVGANLTFDGAVQRAAQHTDHTVVIVDLTGEPHKKVIAMIRQAARAISMPSLGTLSMALVTPPEHASEWLTASRAAHPGVSAPGQLVELQRFNRPGIKQWMHEAGLGFQDESSQDTLLRITGGWPSLISRVTNELARPNSDREQALERCRAYLERHPAEFVRSTGVLSGQAIAAAWATLVEWSEVTTPDTLAEVLAMTGADDATHPLYPANLQQEGFIAASDLVEVLRILGALVVLRDGMMQPEQVLLSATRRMGTTA
ncbi:hypothetical protein [Nonomuraea soli]|uniref:Novel STAND NTPase 1 domain-containing protein n=1 Tax=Nonomuraea soli TaxID=1032476 RepID=A0A7W0HTC9_9ACTN|nr:hypothetical protein [Nonomuraea soli]MBA2894910.1 hypothetical protein [Nonomuraea soli]